MDKFGWSRKKCVTLCSMSIYFIGIPCALLFYNLLASIRSFWSCHRRLVDLPRQVDILIPLGGLAAALLIGWRWKGKAWIEEIKEGSSEFIRRNGSFGLI